MLSFVYLEFFRDAYAGLPQHGDGVASDRIVEEQGKVIVGRLKRQKKKRLDMEWDQDLKQPTRNSRRYNSGILRPASGGPLARSGLA